MKTRIIKITLVLCALFIASDIFAVERKEKSSQNTKSKKSTTQQPSSSNTANSSNTDSAKARKVDTFVDANKNGIDDRQEKPQQPAQATPPPPIQTQKSKPKPAPAKSKDSTAAKKPSL